MKFFSFFLVKSREGASSFGSGCHGLMLGYLSVSSRDHPTTPSQSGYPIVTKSMAMDISRSQHKIHLTYFHYGHVSNEKSLVV